MKALVLPLLLSIVASTAAAKNPSARKDMSDAMKKIQAKLPSGTYMSADGDKCTLVLLWSESQSDGVRFAASLSEPTKWGLNTKSTSIRSKLDDVSVGAERVDGAIELKIYKHEEIEDKDADEPVDHYDGIEVTFENGEITFVKVGEAWINHHSDPSEDEVMCSGTFKKVN